MRSRAAETSKPQVPRARERTASSGEDGRVTGLRTGRLGESRRMPKGPAQGDGAFPRAGSPRSGHGGPCGRRGLSCGDRWQVRRSHPAHRNVCGSQQLPFSSRGTFFLPASPPTPALTATAPFHNPATFMLDEGATSTHAAGRAGRTPARGASGLGPGRQRRRPSRVPSPLLGES